MLGLHDLDVDAALRLLRAGPAALTIVTYILFDCHILCVCHYTQRMTGVKSRREMYSAATRAALLEEAATLFAERGYSRTSLEDVASASQVSNSPAGEPAARISYPS